jgi:pimeloyl-ACP methyl ester carboxylesterase
LPFAEHRGQRIHYTVEGRGSLVILQHGLLLNAESWKRSGIVAALTDRFRVACIDSLGHGQSDKPSDPALYDQEQRAGDIIAVIDDLGCDRAHVVGHSMGGWLAVGVAKFHPKRLASLVVGGWDLLNGLPRGKSGPLTFEAFMAFAKLTAPRLTEWVTSELEPGVLACFEALFQLEGAREAVLSTSGPVMLWNGREDTPHEPMRGFAAADGLRFLSVAGDHLGPLFRHGAESAKGIRGFLEGVP